MGENLANLWEFSVKNESALLLALCTFPTPIRQSSKSSTKGLIFKTFLKSAQGDKFRQTVFRDKWDYRSRDQNFVAKFKSHFILQRHLSQFCWKISINCFDSKNIPIPIFKAIILDLAILVFLKLLYFLNMEYEE